MICPIQSPERSDPRTSAANNGNPFPDELISWPVHRDVDICLCRDSFDYGSDWLKGARDGEKSRWR